MRLVLVRLKSVPQFAEGMWLVGELLGEGEFGLRLKDTCVIYEILQKGKSGGELQLTSNCAAQDLFTNSPYTVSAGEFDGLRDVVEGEHFHKQWLSSLDAFRLQKAGLHAPPPIQKNLNGAKLDSAAGLT